MTSISLTVNGDSVDAAVEPRVHLADFLRERLLLTGTHIGCEHGVCGACTLLVDGSPTRSCITFAAACDGSDVRTVEGLDDDPVTARLRDAFKAEHALQCGYCTPGMLVTARDIVHRLPDADDERVRLELSGNLCRCTGYLGIVRAIRRVLDEGAIPAGSRDNAPLPVWPELPRADIVRADAAVVAAVAVPAAAPTTARDGGASTLRQSLLLNVPLERVWSAVKDPALIASCVPGLTVVRVDGDEIEGRMDVALGPIKARFTGRATVNYVASAYAGSITGEGRDGTTGTRLGAAARFDLAAPSPAETRIDLAIDYTLRGPLAQFSRGSIVQGFAEEIAASAARSLEARLLGQSGEPLAASTQTSSSLGIGAILARLVWQRLRKLLTPG
ncbi:MAG TPA: 2Fe-2S iron-sulfur cluster-binding protein [Stellaceae bacterium]